MPHACGTLFLSVISDRAKIVVIAGKCESASARCATVGDRMSVSDFPFLNTLLVDCERIQLLVGHRLFKASREPYTK